MLTLFAGKTKSGQEFFIRYLMDGDIEQILQYINTISSEQTFLTFQGEQLTHQEEKEYLDSYLKKIADKKAVKLLAFVGSELAGIADIEMKGRTSSHIGLFGITVAKKFRNSGIGSKLIQLTINEAIKNLPDLKIIELSVFANNLVARKLYQKMGFVEYGVLPEGIKYKDGFVNHIYLYKKIN